MSHLPFRSFVDEHKDKDVQIQLQGAPQPMMGKVTLVDWDDRPDRDRPSQWTGVIYEIVCEAQIGRNQVARMAFTFRESAVAWWSSGPQPIDETPKIVSPLWGDS